MRQTHATRGASPAYALRASSASKIPDDLRAVPSERDGERQWFRHPFLHSLVPALLAAVILVVDDIDGRLVAIQHAVQDAGLVAIQNPVIGQDATDTEIDARRNHDKGAALVAVAGQDATQKTARIGLTNGSDSKNSGYTSELCNHFSLLFCLITPSGVTELYI